MSSMEIDRLVQERRLIRESFGDAQVAGYWARAAASFADAQTAGLSSAGALHLVYTAALRWIVAVLALHGLRVTATGDDDTAFDAAQNLDRALGGSGEQLGKVCRACAQRIYEPEQDDSEITIRLRHAVGAIRDALPAIRSEILTVRPALAASLPLPGS